MQEPFTVAARGGSLERKRENLSESRKLLLRIGLLMEGARDLEIFFNNSIPTAC
jgi:hypothetical protein